MKDHFNAFDRWVYTYDEDMQKANDSGDWMFCGYYRLPLIHN